MSDSRLQSAEWLEWSGLPAQLNNLRANGWLVFKKIVELDCRLNRNPDAVEITLKELGERCGLDWEKTSKVIEALTKKRVLASFLPDNDEEKGLYRVRVPIKTPRTAEEVALQSSDPYLREPSSFRYLTKPEPNEAKLENVQKVVDLYLNTLSQKVNSFIVDHIEILAERFPYESIRRTMERAAKHDLRSIGWVAKELMRDAKKETQKKNAPRTEERSERRSKRSSL